MLGSLSLLPLRLQKMLSTEIQLKNLSIYYIVDLSNK